MLNNKEWHLFLSICRQMFVRVEIIIGVAPAITTTLVFDDQSNCDSWAMLPTGSLLLVAWFRSSCMAKRTDGKEVDEVARNLKSRAPKESFQSFVPRKRSDHTTKWNAVSIFSSSTGSRASGDPSISPYPIICVPSDRPFTTCGWSYQKRCGPKQREENQTKFEVDLLFSWKNNNIGCLLLSFFSFIFFLLLFFPQSSFFLINSVLVHDEIDVSL